MPREKRREDYPAAQGREEEWIAEPLSLLYNPGQQHEQTLADRCILIEERRTADGGVIGMDITAMKQREASFRLLFEENPVPMFVLRRDTQAFLAANAAAISHYAYARDKIVTMTLGEQSCARSWASGLDMKVVAEGDQGGPRLPRRRGVQGGQGYYFGYAQPQSEVLNLLAMGKVRDVA